MNNGHLKVGISPGNKGTLSFTVKSKLVVGMDGRSGFGACIDTCNELVELDMVVRLSDSSKSIIR
jgi:hypothetical protein